jgi:hypothetical protein
MNDGCESVWLRGSERRLLRDFCGKAGLSRSVIIRRGLLEFLNGKASDELLRRCLLERELDALFREERRLRRIQSKILSNAAYLRQYARQLIHGGWEEHGARFRPPLANSPNADLLIKAFEGTFHHRGCVGKRIAEISLELYPGEYGLRSLPSSDQNTRNTSVKKCSEPQGDENRE